MHMNIGIAEPAYLAALCALLVIGLLSNSAYGQQRGLVSGAMHFVISAMFDSI